MTGINGVEGIGYRAYVIIAPIALVVLLVSIWTVWPYRRRQVAVSLIWYLALVGGFLTANLLELISPSPFATVAWAKTGQTFLLASGLAWFALSLVYAGFETFDRWKHFKWISLPAFVMTALVWTTDLHHLFWRSTGVARIAGFTVVRPTYGPAFWIAGFYLYVLLGVGVTLFLLTGARSRRLVRQQSNIISLAALIPIAVNLIHVFRVFPSLQKDYTPVAFALSGFFFYLAVHRYNMLRVGPVQHQTVLEDVPSAVLTVDSDGTVLDLNDQAQDLLHLDSAVIGRQIPDIPTLASLLQGVPLHLRNNFEASWPSGTPSGTPAGTPTAARPPERDRHFDIWIKPLHHMSGRPSGAIITITDVTPWVTLLEDRNRAYTDLEAEQNRLIHLQMQLRRQERLATIGQLAAGMAHEISNPLTYIRSGFRELERTTRQHLQEQHLETQHSRQVLADINDGLDRIEGVVRTLLEYARGAAPTKTRQETDFSLLVHNTIALVRPGLRDITIDVTNTTPILVRCSGDEISQVLLNLLLNAVQAIETAHDTSPRDKRITVDYHTRNNRLICTITDTGPGVPDHLRDHIFEPFTTSRATDSGTGLGLSISRDIIQNSHNGRLYLADGLPTSFVLELPLQNKS